ncbi:MAG: histidinol-phosphate transaminase [Gammaproteobacteria bacterium]|nr:histidinol-phosphate transaminase [Gammaproteobacteria bacterium]
MSSSNADLTRFWSHKVHELSPYVPGEQPKLNNLVKLNTNENPFPPSPKVLAAMEAQLGDTLRLYPDPNATELRQCLAGYAGLSADQVFVGNGSDEVLAHAFQALLQHDQALLFPDISYSFYPVYCGLYGIEKDEVPLAKDLTINVADYQSPNGGVILANPNAPTGELLGLTAIRQLLTANPDRVVVIDEAYIDFGGQSAIELVPAFDNLLVIQTLSKSRSLAGLRVGFAFGQHHLIEALERVKNSFNSYPLSREAQAGAIAAIEDEDYFQHTCQANIAQRDKLALQLQALGFSMTQSYANFLFVTHAHMAAKDIALLLRKRGIIVRHLTSSPRITNYLRISVGSSSECDTLVLALKALL